MDEREPSCGEELAASAEVPIAVGALFRHVTLNLRAHARWVGTSSDAARAEHDALLGVALQYEGLADAADRAAQHMRSLRALAPAPHDVSTFDRTQFERWSETKHALQRELAQLLLAHAAAS